MSLRTLCEDQTNLSSSDISLLETLEASLQATADLTDSDIFLDCLIKDKSSAIVIAEANPRFHASAYKATVAGMYAFEKNEPAVFHSFASGMPCGT